MMKRLLSLVTVVSLLAIILLPTTANAANGVVSCDPTVGDSDLFLGMPHWYEYLKSGKQLKLENSDTILSVCTPQFTEKDGGGMQLIDIWLIALAIIGMLLRIGGIAALFMVIFGGIKYITSQGNPDATKGARQTIINAFIGIVITIIAAASVNFGAHLLQK